MKKVVITLASIGLLASACTIYNYYPAVNDQSRPYNSHRQYVIELHYSNGYIDTLAVDNFRSYHRYGEENEHYQIQPYYQKWVTLNNVNFIKIINTRE